MCVSGERGHALALAQVATPLMSFNIGDVSEKGPFFTLNARSSKTSRTKCTCDKCVEAQQ